MRSPRFGAAVLVTFAAALSACAPSSPAARQPLVVAIQPSLSATDVLEKAQPLEAYLESAIPGVDVQLYVPMSQAGVIEALRFGHAHVAFMGAWPAYLAVSMAGAELALAEVREVTIGGERREATSYSSYWVVPAASRVRTLPELKGARACFPSPISTSGFVAPVGRLVELGLVARPDGREADPAAFFGHVRFGGGYAQCWEALKAGQADVTIIAGDVPEALYRDVLAATRVVEEQGPIPSHAVVLSARRDEPLRGRTVRALAGLGAPEHRALMRGVISGIFVRFEPSTADAHFGALQRYLDRAGLAYTERIGAR